MLKESDAALHGQASSSVPATPSPKSSGSLNGASSNGATTSKTTRHLDDSDLDGQKIQELLNQLFRAFIKKVSPKYRKRILNFLGIISLMCTGGLGGYFIHQPNNLSSSSNSTTTFSTPLMGIDMFGYCASLDYSMNGEQGGDDYCYSAGFNNNNLDAICNLQYPGNSDLHFKYGDPSNLRTGGCYPAQGKSLGGVNLDKYCISIYSDKGGMPRSATVNNTWVCQIKVDLVAACSWQNNEHNLQARKDNQNHRECYGA